MWKVPPARILVPVDFSEASGHAVAVAAALAARVGAHLHLFHGEMLEAPPYFTHEQLKMLERERRVARAHAEEFLADFARRHGAGDFTSEIVEGLPTAAILAAAGHADFVVMGTHGRRGPARWWLGSVAERVIHEAPVPVLVVRSGGGTPPAEVFLHPMVVSATGVPGERAAEAAMRLAAAIGGEVVTRAATCAADLAGEQHASLVVVASGARDGALLPHPAEQWLRRCTLPMLFVPAMVPA